MGGGGGGGGVNKGKGRGRRRVVREGEGVVVEGGSVNKGGEG